MEPPRHLMSAEEKCGLFPWTPEAKRNYLQDRDLRRLRVVMEILNSEEPLAERTSSLIKVCVLWNQMDTIYMQKQHLTGPENSVAGGHPYVHGVHYDKDLLTWAEGFQIEYHGLSDFASEDEEPQPVESSNAGSSSARGDAVRKAG